MAVACTTLPTTQQPGRKSSRQRRALKSAPSRTRRLWRTESSFENGRDSHYAKWVSCDISFRQNNGFVSTRLSDMCRIFVYTHGPGFYNNDITQTKRLPCSCLRFVAIELCKALWWYLTRPSLYIAFTVQIVVSSTYQYLGYWFNFYTVGIYRHPWY